MSRRGTVLGAGMFLPINRSRAGARINPLSGRSPVDLNESDT